MKIDSLLIIGAAAAGLFLVYKTVQKKPADTAAQSKLIINSALPGDPAWGWTYYTDGTAIGPDGKYYYQGAQVYDPAGMMGTQS